MGFPKYSGRYLDTLDDHAFKLWLLNTSFDFFQFWMEFSLVNVFVSQKSIQYFWGYLREIPNFSAFMCVSKFAS